MIQRRVLHDMQSPGPDFLRQYARNSESAYTSAMLFVHQTVIYSGMRACIVYRHDNALT